MKISIDWLNSLLSTPGNPDTISKILTATGLEVEGSEVYETVKGSLEGIVVGEVLSCEKHPGADRLKITTVNTGSGAPVQIVCGAANVAAGQKVIVATPGATLYPVEGDSFQIKKSKIRGEVSEGMICAEDEIGLGQSHDGIMVLAPDAVPGTPAAQLFNLQSDTVLEIGLTPNRSDATSHLGVARDLVAASNAKGDNLHVKFPALTKLNPAQSPTIRVEVKNPERCPRYAGAYIAGVTVKPSPDWIQNRLKAVGLRPVNNIVDITNYVMLELGQPMHAFDADKIEGKTIVVRKADAGTIFTTLDGIERKLSGEELMICDATSPLCIAGVFGGKVSGVTESTTNIFLESAYFDPVAVRKAAKAHGLRTDSSFRFERGADPESTITALERAINLLSETDSINPEGYVDCYPEKLQPASVAFSPEAFRKLSGLTLGDEVIISILKDLDIKVEAANKESWNLEVPRFRADVTRQQDVTEEILRIVGFDQVPLPQFLKVPVKATPEDLLSTTLKAAGQHLTGAGFTEMMNNSLTSTAYYPDRTDVVKILNPLSTELDVMRPDMVATSLQTVAYNLNRQQHSIRLFETGKVYEKTESAYRERFVMTLVTAGTVQDQHWQQSERKADFFYLKGAVEGLLERFGITTESRVAEKADYGWVMEFFSGSRVFGHAGQIDGKHAARFDIDTPVYMAELDWKQVMKANSSQKLKYSEIPKFPAVRRDLALLVEKQMSYQSLREIALKNGGKILQDVKLFDVYEGKNIPSGKVSYALSFVLGAQDRTLNDKEIEKTMTGLLEAFKTAGAELRS